MKALIVSLSVLAFLVVAFFLFAFDELRADRRSQFVTAVNGLREAHLELHQYGGFTNYSHSMTVYLYTNRVTADGTSYQCEFAVTNDWFQNRGFLTITTNEVFVWIDNKRGVMPLGTRANFPPGF
jgi:hypothetical protein